MRVLLDAHLSDAIVGEALREAGHDVRAASSEPGLEGLSDVALLTLAQEENRVLVTGDVKDFSALVRARGRTRRTHAGCVIVTRIGNRTQQEIAQAVAASLEGSDEQDAWVDKVLFVTRASP